MTINNKYTIISIIVIIVSAKLVCSSSPKFSCFRRRKDLREPQRFIKYFIFYMLANCVVLVWKNILISQL